MPDNDNRTSGSLTIVAQPGGNPAVPDLVVDRPDLARLRQVDAVFQGGGALGAAYIGALRALHDNGIGFARVAGTSAGAITASLIAAGYTAPEIQFLTSSFLKGTRPPSSLAAIGLEKPIDFMSFLDTPDAASVRPMRRQTGLWNLLNLSVVDTIGRELERVYNGAILPDRAAIVATCVSGIKGVPVLGDIFRNEVANQALTQALSDALTVLPEDGLRPSDLLPDTAPLRAQIADALWDEFAAREPLLPIVTNLVHRGGIFHGDAFVETMEDLLLRKAPSPQGDPPRFADLPVPLAVLTCDLGTGKPVVYSRGTRPTMSVAEAVRRSMSMPFVFEPRNGYVDGGLLSSFPVWLFASAGDGYWPATARDAARTKIGFILDERVEADFDEPVAAAKFTLNAQGAIEPLDALGPVLIEKMVEAGYPRSSATTALGWIAASGNGPQIPLVTEVEGLGRLMLGAEAEMRSIFTPALMQDRPYIEVLIPLRGFHSLDFLVNSSAGHLRAMWDRAWRATIRELAGPAAVGLLTPPTITKSPFRK